MVVIFGVTITESILISGAEGVTVTVAVPKISVSTVDLAVTVIVVAASAGATDSRPDELMVVPELSAVLPVMLHDTL